MLKTMDMTLVSQQCLRSHIQSDKTMDFPTKGLVLSQIASLTSTSSPSSSPASQTPIYTRVVARLLKAKPAQFIIDQITPDLLLIVNGSRKEKLERRKQERVAMQQHEAKLRLEEEAKEAAVRESVFIDSLGGGGGGDEDNNNRAQRPTSFGSEYSYSDPEEEFAEMGPKKKNRMGQRARRE